MLPFLEDRDEKTEMRKKQQEMKAEYEKYKTIEEERFRNRFADKKTAINQNTSYNATTELKSVDYPSVEMQDGYINTILSKLEALERNMSDLTCVKLKERSIDEDIDKSQNFSSFDLNRKQSNELNSLNHVFVVKETEKRLNELEKIVTDLKFSEKNEQMLTDNQQVHSCKSDDVITPTAVFEEDACSKGRFLNLHGSANSRERLKKIEKNKYASELQQQIEERQRLREINRRKEMEEDQRKVNEMKIYDSFGNKLKEEESNLNSQVIETKQLAYSRGGNGIFGEPLTEKQKEANMRYRSELLEQIAERKVREEETRLQDNENEQHKTTELPLAGRENIAITDSKEDNHSLSSTSPAKLAELKTMQESSPNARKHSVGLQIKLDETSPYCGIKPTKVIRRLGSKDNPRVKSSSADLLAQIEQLKLELSAEKLRIQQSGVLLERPVQIYDPRSAYAPFSFAWRFGYRPAKVHRNSQPIKHFNNLQQITNPSTLKSRHFYYRRSSMDSDVTFLMDETQNINRSPSLGSLNLNEFNRKREIKPNLRNANLELYKNEESIIQEFMAEEEARRRMHAQ